MSRRATETFGIAGGYHPGARVPRLDPPISFEEGLTAHLPGIASTQTKAEAKPKE
jgi:hypothetical protein